MRVDNLENLLHPGQLEIIRDQKLSPIRRHRQLKILDKVMAVLGSSGKADIELLSGTAGMPADQARTQLLLMLGLVMREHHNKAGSAPEEDVFDEDTLVAQLKAISETVSAADTGEISNLQAFQHCMVDFPYPASLPIALQIQYGRPEPGMFPEYERWAAAEGHNDRARLVLIAAYLQCLDPVRALELLAEAPVQESMRCFFEYYFALAHLQLGDRNIARASAEKIDFSVHEEMTAPETGMLAEMRQHAAWLITLPELA